MAYEWQFLHVNDYHRMHMKMDEGGRPAFSPDDGLMSDRQVQVSGELARLFPSYVNSLHLKDEAGNELTLDEAGAGTFKEYMEDVVLASARKAIESGVDVSHKSWLVLKDNVPVNMDWHQYAKDITRMKTAPAFDALSMDSPENDLFGSATTSLRHFTEYSRHNSLTGGEMAELAVVKMMNPMDYIEDSEAVTAKHWRIRHGECDRDTSLAISAMFALKLKEIGCDVDYHSPWDVPHAGDYDLDELFVWIDEICKDKI